MKDKDLRKRVSELEKNSRGREIQDKYCPKCKEKMPMVPITKLKPGESDYGGMGFFFTCNRYDLYYRCLSCLGLFKVLEHSVDLEEVV